MNCFKDLNKFQIHRKTTLILEVYDPVSKEFLKDIFENDSFETVGHYRNEDLDGTIVYTFHFSNGLTKKSIKCINEILGNNVFAMIHSESEDKFVKEFSKICLKHLDFSKVEFP